jgi:hypothetical protein
MNVRLIPLLALVALAHGSAAGKSLAACGAGVSEDRPAAKTNEERRGAHSAATPKASPDRTAPARRATPQHHAPTFM